jgi:hypothetical protein
MAKLTTAERNALPAKDFAGPHRSYPIENASHARNAKSRVSQFGSASLKKKVDAKADKKLGKKSPQKRG